jgi:murein DD-endopeptidase MepM/ murein hydrolase activator NlpD
VKEGDSVAGSQIVGLVGSTGRHRPASHWALSVNGARSAVGVGLVVKKPGQEQRHEGTKHTKIL